MAILLPVKHRPGRHCASTALQNLVNYQGIHWSEAFCFGLGAGLGIFLIELPDYSPGNFIHVRSADLEDQFFRRIGYPEAHRTYDKNSTGERELCRLLSTGFPVLVQTDIYYLPYYQTKTHFPGHAVTVWGFDEREQQFFITDTERKALLQVHFADMSRARFCRGLFMDLKGDLFYPGVIEPPPEMGAACREAVLANSRVLMNESSDFQGIDALNRWRSAIRRWHEFDDWQWSARFCYQVIERRGTGGGGFRLIYADFLQEASHFLPEIASAGLPGLMKQLGQAWRELALTLKEISEKDQPDFRSAARLINLVYDREATYHQRVLELWKELP